jgi:hypothetical protein
MGRADCALIVDGLKWGLKSGRSPHRSAHFVFDAVRELLNLGQFAQLRGVEGIGMRAGYLGIQFIDEPKQFVGIGHQGLLPFRIEGAQLLFGRHPGIVGIVIGVAIDTLANGLRQHGMKLTGARLGPAVKGRQQAKSERQRKNAEVETTR